MGESGLVFKCTLCEEATFANKHSLNEHYDSVHEGKILFGRNVGWILQCITCLNVFSSKPKIIDHIRSVHGFPKVIAIENQCSDPEKSVQGNYKIQTYKPHRFFKPQRDLDEHHNQENKNCSNCDETFKS